MTKSTKWFLGILGVIALLVLAFAAFVYWVVSTSDEQTETVTTGRGEKIAIVELRGQILSSEDVVRQLKKYRDNRSVRAILLRIDSPGGGVAASQEMYEEVRATRDAGKPVVVSMGSIAASGGYYVACGGSRLVANRGTLTGSIGVISEFLQYGDALRKLGIDIKTIKAGKLKDSGSPTHKMTDEEQKYFQNLMEEVHRQFISVVETERDLKHDEVIALADGRVFTGEQAVELGLVDTLGTYEDAIRIAADLVGIRGEPSIVKERKRAAWWEPLLGEANSTLRELKQELLERPILSYRYAGAQ
jgi:protease-4